MVRQIKRLAVQGKHTKPRKKDTTDMQPTNRAARRAIESNRKGVVAKTKKFHRL